MTVEEFRKAKPEFAHLEGDQLWDEMSNYMMRQQTGEEYLRPFRPFWQRYMLRYLFYRVSATTLLPPYSHQRCKRCKGGRNMKLYFPKQDEDGKLYMVHSCGALVSEVEPNTNWDYLLWLFWHNWKEIAFWKPVQWIHLVKTDRGGGRYSMFGDEAHYVKEWIVRDDRYRMVLHPRPWWQYIVILRK